MFDKIKITIQEHRYRKYIENHKNNVFQAFVEMVMCPDMNWLFCQEGIYNALIDRVLVHDDSKFSTEEFDAYRKNFYPINKKEKEDNKQNFLLAWEHHYKNNRHHWQARQYDQDDELSFETIMDIIENVCDWLAMGYNFGDRPYQYYEKNKDFIKLPQKQQELLEKIIYQGIDKECIQKHKNLTKERKLKYGQV